jgi:hypothetical protein
MRVVEDWSLRTLVSRPTSLRGDNGKIECCLMPLGIS